MSAQPERPAPRPAAPPSNPAGRVVAIRGRFPRTGKLLRHGDFQRVYQRGRRQFAPHMTVFYLERNPSLSNTRSEKGGPATECGPRVGLTVGRVLGGAVERNRIKRRMREAVRSTLSNVTSAVDIVINPKKSVLTLEFAALREEVGRALAAVQEKAVASPGPQRESK